MGDMYTSITYSQQLVTRYTAAAGDGVEQAKP